MNNTFDATKNRIESIKINKEIDCIRTITLNISEFCNLKCLSCPRSQGYQNRDIYMFPAVAYKIKQRLDEINYNGIISISGMGEPFAHPCILSILEYLKDYKVQILTNGLYPSKDYKKASKYAKIIVSVHNENNIQTIKDNIGDIEVTYRNHDINSEKCELIQTNRGGWINVEHINQPCFFPFYKVFIDIDGSYLLCPDDWKRISRKDNVNIYTMSIKEYFCNYIKSTKNILLDEGRIFEPCCCCSANGTLMGANIVEEYKCRFKNE